MDNRSSAKDTEPGANRLPWSARRRKPVRQAALTWNLAEMFDPEDQPQISALWGKSW